MPQALGKTASSFIWDDKLKAQAKRGWISCGRYALVVFNVLFFVSEILLLVLGAFLVCFGVWFIMVPANQNLMFIIASGTTRNTTQLCMYAIVITGVCTILFANVGCCGAISNSKYVLGLFFLFLVVLFVQLVTIGGLSLWLSLEIKADVGYQMQKSLMESYMGDSAVNQESVAWNSVQKGFKCCGFSDIDGYKDYTNKSKAYPDGSMWWIQQSTKANPVRWPESCCRETIYGEEDRQKCQATSERPEEVVFSEGCKKKTEEFVRENLLIVTAIAVSLALIEVVHFVTIRRLEALIGEDTQSEVTTFSMDDQTKMADQS